MPIARASVADVRSTLAGILRSDLKRAAGADKILQPNELAQVLPFSAKVANDLGAGDHSVNDVMDEAMSRATLAWGAVNQSSGSGKVWLSKAEIAKLKDTDPLLAEVTGAAAAIVLRRQSAPAQQPLKAVLDAPAGVSMTVSGARTLDITISADPSVAVGTSFALVVDGQHRLELERGPSGLNTYELVSPPGYGIEVLERSLMTAPTSTARIKITRDPASWPSEEELKIKARVGLEKFIREERVNDSDWQDYFPTTWAELQQRGIPAQLDAFFTSPDTEVIRKQDSVIWVGRGPFDLYTEVEMEKATGKVKRAYVEID